MKEEIEKMYVQALIDDLPPNVFADQVLRLFSVSPCNYEYEMLFDTDRVQGWYPMSKELVEKVKADGNFTKGIVNGTIRHYKG